MENNKKRVLSGIRASGRIHLGNYFGAVQGMLELQNKGDLETLYMVADLHTLTTPYEKEKLTTQVKEVILDYLACGLDPKKSIVFIQSMIPQHVILAYYFSTITNVARMRHLPTYKDKVKQHPKNVSMALLNYPVLMAADILVYNASYVPVGVDQEPHLEVSREIARKMNSEYGTTFPEPIRYETVGGYVPSLTGIGKMSKSVEGSAIYLTDTEDVIKNKIAKVPTDSGKGSSAPTQGGVATLFTLIELVEGQDKRKYYENEYVSHGVRYGDLKNELSRSIYNYIKPMQEKRKELESNPNYIKEVVEKGSSRAVEIASSVLGEVEEKMGLHYSF